MANDLILRPYVIREEERGIFFGLYVGGSKEELRIKGKRGFVIDKSNNHP